MVPINCRGSGAAAQGVRSRQMPFGIRRQVEQIRAYAEMVAAEAQSGQVKELAARSIGLDDLELTALRGFVLTAFGA